MKVIEVVNMLSNATFHELLPDVLATVSTTALSLAVGEKSVRDCLRGFPMDRVRSKAVAFLDAPSLLVVSVSRCKHEQHHVES